MTPTVAIGLMNACTSRAANRFFCTLSATTPNPVSSTASRASASAWAAPAPAMASTIASIWACEHSARTSWARLARAASVRASATDAWSRSLRAVAGAEAIDAVTAGLTPATGCARPRRGAAE